MMNKRYRETDEDRHQNRSLQQEQAERERARQQSGDPRENDESRAERGRQRSQPGSEQSQAEESPRCQQGGWQSEMERKSEERRMPDFDREENLDDDPRGL
jgi:hypothetical protein